MERAALSAAIEDYEKAAAYLDRVEATIAQKNSLNLSLWAEIDQATEALTEAKKREPSRLVAALITADGAELEQDEPNLAQAEATLAALRDKQAQNRADLALLEDARRGAAQACSLTASTRLDAIRRVICAEGNIEGWRDAYHTAQRRAASLLAALYEVSFAAPKDWHGRPVLERSLKPEEIDRAPSEQWSSVLKMLETDPDAPLPEITT